MTKEELEKEIRKYLKKTFHHEYYDDVVKVMMFAEPREKRIAELEEKISVLLSCKNCSENKGGLICVKEYENKCLAQKIQFIKELQEENAELKEKSKRQSNNYKYDVDMLIEGNKYKNEVCKELAHQANVIQGQLTKAKEIIREYKNICNNAPFLDEKEVELKEQAEQFLSEVEK